MSPLSFKIAYPIIITGLFVIVSFVALDYNNLNTNGYIIFLLLVFLYVLLFGFVTGQRFANLIKMLLQKAKAVSKGDLQSRMYVKSQDELGQLATVFNNIADRLKEAADENEKIKKLAALSEETQIQGLKEIIDSLEKKVQNRTFHMEQVVKDLDVAKENLKVKAAELIKLQHQLAQLQEKQKKRQPGKPKKANNKEI